MARRRFLIGCAVMALGCVLLTGCASSSGKALVKTNAHPTATTFSTPTATIFTPPNISVTPTNGGDQTPICASGIFGDIAMPQGYVQQGDILLGALDFQSFPNYQLPSSLPLAPYQVTSAVGGKGGHGPVSWSGLPLSNPGSAFSFMLCNASATQTHTLTSVALKVASFAPYSGALNEVGTCATVYSRQGMSGGGCGGGSAYDMSLVGTFPANAPTGTEITLQNSQMTNLNLPVTLTPHQLLDIEITPTLPQLSGTYSYQVGVSIDGGPVAYVAGGTSPALWAPVTHSWDGNNCTSPAMQAQIPPATNPPTYYICPA